MRALFLLLVLLNLGYFTWQWQQPGDVKPPAGGLPIAVAPDTKTLTLLSELHNNPDAKASPPRSDSLQEAAPPTQQDAAP